MALLKISRMRKLKTGDIYISINSSSQRLAYIRKGLIRTFMIKENGEDITLMLRWEDQFIASVDSVVHQRPSRFIYQALENTVLLEVDYQKSQPLINANPRLSDIRNKILLHILAQAMERIENFVLLSPEEHYMKLVDEKPDMINRVPDKYLATMLGITPVSLSRIRKRIVRPPRH